MSTASISSDRSTEAPLSSDEGSQPFGAEVRPQKKVREFVISMLSGQRDVVALQSDEDLLDLHAAIANKFSIPAQQQVLIHKLQELDSLDGFAPGDKVHLLLVQNATQDARHLEWLMEVEVAGSKGAADWLQQAPLEAKEDFAVVARAVILNAEALEHAPWEFRKHQELVLRAVQTQGYLLMYAAPEMQGDREVVLAAVRNSGSALQYATPALVKDREVVGAAIAENGNALRFASPELRADRSLVLAAVSRHGAALQVATQALKADKEVVLAAVANNPEALSCACAQLRVDDDVLQAATPAGEAAGGKAAEEIKKAAQAKQQLREERPKRERKRDSIMQAIASLFRAASKERLPTPTLDSATVAEKEVAASLVQETS